jgi:hypothetical protein
MVLEIQVKVFWVVMHLIRLHKMSMKTKFLLINVVGTTT